MMGYRIAGCDLGKASVSCAIFSVNGNNDIFLEESESLPHDGNPFEVFKKWYTEKEIFTCDALGTTGLYAEELTDRVLILPEDTCNEAALEHNKTLPDTLNLVSVGARGYSVLTRKPFNRQSSNNDRKYHYQFLENDKCSSGTGENIRKIAGRFGLGLVEADKMALNAEKSIPITARCSVFAKSEMTHYANQGKSTPDLLSGYFESVARNTKSLLSRNEVDGPVYLIGGVAHIGSFLKSFKEIVQKDVFVLEDNLVFEAIGAALIANEHVAENSVATLPENPEDLISLKKKRFAVLTPAYESRDKVTILNDTGQAPSWENTPSVLGLDLGSTGAKAVLTSLQTGGLLMDVYDQTRGNPVDAARRLITEILEKGTPDVRAISLTGSGREAVATLSRTIFPQQEIVFVQNEIIAHAEAAIYCDPDNGKDMSIIEIGGQDAKYIRISDGRIIESDLNKACSAGTGSFLEEQACFYDVHEIEDFIHLAKDAGRPPDLGQMCTVYIAEAGAEALKDGFSLGDIFAGFQYSVIHNYLNRVMGQRTLGKKVFFQGKPASNPSLSWTLASVTDREIIVPNNPGAMGAWGIGISAIKEIGKERLLDMPSLDLPLFLTAEIIDRSEFTCKDKTCNTLCPIERTTISFNGTEKTATSGGACPKYELSNPTHKKLDKDAPNPFLVREKLIDNYEKEVSGSPVVGIPVTGAVGGYIPYLATLIHELGFSVKILKSHKGCNQNRWPQFH